MLSLLVAVPLHWRSPGPGHTAQGQSCLMCATYGYALLGRIVDFDQALLTIGNCY
ncbi:hypothetical protein [Chitinolyticbacter albus]|uniref:hypothetical protein n=1 Tax=Chitinolyticbacter albus TaxID=2961951 RepID=UPI00210B08FC|nr:hypothetical protein [Chitinolyticbacter albus]